MAVKNTLAATWPTLREWISSTGPAVNPRLSGGYSLSQAQICSPFLTWSIHWYAKEFNQAKLPDIKRISLCSGWAIVLIWLQWLTKPLSMVFCCPTLKVTPRLYPNDWGSANTHHRCELKDCSATSCLTEDKMDSILWFSQFPRRWPQQCWFKSAGWQLQVVLLVGEGIFWIHQLDGTFCCWTRFAIEETLREYTWNHLGVEVNTESCRGESIFFPFSIF